MPITLGDFPLYFWDNLLKYLFWQNENSHTNFPKLYYSSYKADTEKNKNQQSTLWIQWMFVGQIAITAKKLMIFPTSLFKYHAIKLGGRGVSKNIISDHRGEGGLKEGRIWSHDTWTAPYCLTSCSSGVRALVCQLSSPGSILAISLMSAYYKKLKLWPTLTI